MLHTRLLAPRQSVATVAFMLLAGIVGAAGQQFRTIHTFTGKPDGTTVWGRLTADKLGNLYGTAGGGGSNNQGCVFELLAPTGSGGSWTESILYSFKGGTSDGGSPLTGVIFDKSGSLFGTTFNGGTNSLGTVFELSPSTGGVWTETVIYNFIKNQNRTTGSGPNDLLLANSGVLYGSSLYGGSGYGNAFALKPSGASWLEQSFFSFSGANGQEPNYEGASLVSDAKGNLYGSTTAGGTHGAGVVFELSPPTVPGNPWTGAVLYSFGAYPTDGVSDPGGVVLDSAGNLYGATVAGGTGSGSTGTVFELSPPAITGQPWTETILYNFVGGASDGSAPYSGVAFDKAGNLYGVTYSGGPGNCFANYSGCGTVFKLSPNTGGTWTETILHTFSGTDGQFPYAGVLVEPSGRVYGITSEGGAKGFGTVFAVSP